MVRPYLFLAPISSLAAFESMVSHPTPTVHVDPSSNSNSSSGGGGGGGGGIQSVDVGSVSAVAAAAAAVAAAEEKVRFYEGQLAEADEQLVLAKDVWGASSRILQEQVLSLEAQLSTLQAEAASLRQNLALQEDMATCADKAAEKKHTRMVGFVARLELELTAAKVRASRAEEQARENQEDKLRMQV